MSYRLVLPIDIESRIYDYAMYIADDSPHHALTWLDDVLGRMRNIAKMPESCPISEEESEILGYEVRKLVLGSYIAFYRVDEDAKLVILAEFRHSAQQASPQ